MAITFRCGLLTFCMQVKHTERFGMKAVKIGNDDSDDELTCCKLWCGTRFSLQRRLRKEEVEGYGVERGEKR